MFFKPDTPNITLQIWDVGQTPKGSVVGEKGKSSSKKIVRAANERDQGSKTEVEVKQYQVGIDVSVLSTVLIQKLTSIDHNKQNFSVACPAYF